MSSLRHTFPGHLACVRHRGRSKGSARPPGFMSPGGCPGPSVLRGSRGFGLDTCNASSRWEPRLLRQLLLTPCSLLPPRPMMGACPVSPPRLPLTQALPENLLLLMLLTLVCTLMRFSAFIYSQPHPGNHSPPPRHGSAIFPTLAPTSPHHHHPPIPPLRAGHTQLHMQPLHTPSTLPSFCIRRSLRLPGTLFALFTPAPPIPSPEILSIFSGPSQALPPSPSFPDPPPLPSTRELSFETFHTRQHIWPLQCHRCLCLFPTT